MFDACIHAIKSGYPISAAPTAPTPALELETVMNSVLLQLLEAIKKVVQSHILHLIPHDVLCERLLHTAPSTAICNIPLINCAHISQP